METADRDRSGHPAPATAGTLDAGEQAAEAAGQSQRAGRGQRPAPEAGQRAPPARRSRAARRLPRLRRQAVPAGRRWRRVPGSSWLRRAARTRGPAGELLLCFIAAGVVVTMPLAANLAGRMTGRAGHGELRVGLLVGGAPGHPPGQPVVHPADGGAGRGATRVPHADAAARRAVHPGHPGLRPELLLQPAGDAAARAALLCDVPGGPAVAALGHRRRRGRGVLRPVLHAHPAGLVPPEHRAGRDVPADGAGGVGAAAPHARAGGRRSSWAWSWASRCSPTRSRGARGDRGRAWCCCPGCCGGPAGPGCGRSRSPPWSAPWSPARRSWPCSQEIGVEAACRSARSCWPCRTSSTGSACPGCSRPTPRVTTFGLGALASPFLHGRDNEGMPMFGTVLTVLAIARAGRGVAAPQRLAARRAVARLRRAGPGHLAVDRQAPVPAAGLGVERGAGVRR